MLTITGFHAIEEKIKSLEKNQAKDAMILYDKALPRVKKIIEMAKSCKIECKQVETAVLNKAVSHLNETAREHRGVVLQIKGEVDKSSNIIEFEMMKPFLEMCEKIRDAANNVADKATNDAVCDDEANKASSESAYENSNKATNEKSSKNSLRAQNIAKRSIVVILDSITDPHNTGAIFRSCEQFGVDLVVLPKRRSAVDSEIILRASAGAASWVPTMYTANLARTIEILKEQGYWIYGSDLGGEDVGSFTPDDKIVLVMGSEGSGMSHIVRESCDKIVSVPTCGKLDSLNVSVAAGILIYALSR